MLLKNENQIIRVLKSQGNKALVIDCIKRTMPKWVDGDSLSNYDDCGEDEMYERTDYPFGRELTQKEERIAQERFTTIAGVLPFIGNEQKRNQMIDMLKHYYMLKKKERPSQGGVLFYSFGSRSVRSCRHSSIGSSTAIVVVDARITKSSSVGMAMTTFHHLIAESSTS